MNKKPSLDDDYIKSINKAAKESGNSSKARDTSSAKISRMGRMILLIGILFFALKFGIHIYLATCRPISALAKTPELTAAWQAPGPNGPGYDASRTTTRAGLWLSMPEEDFLNLYTVAKFGGQPVPCVLDTGSDISLVPSSAYFLRYKRSGWKKVFSFFGDNKVVDQVGLKIHYAGLDLDGEAVARWPVGRGAEANGLLGHGIFQGRKVLLDFSRGELFFGVEPTVKERDSMEVDGFGNLILPARFGARDAKVVWDTGCGRTVVSGEFYEKNKGCFEDTGTSSPAHDTLGKVGLQKVYLCRDLTVGGHHFSGHRVWVKNQGLIPGLKGLQPDAILGLDIILNADWYFDLPQKKWTLWGVDPDRLNRWQRKKNSFGLIPWVKEPLVDPSGFVDKEEGDKLRALLGKFSRETGADVRVILLPAVGNWDMGAYSDALGQKWDGATKKWFFFVYSIASGKTGVSIHDPEVKFDKIYNSENVQNILQKVTAGVNSKQYGANRMFRKFMEKIYELYRKK